MIRSLGSGKPLPQSSETTSTCEHGELTPGDAHGDSQAIETVDPRLARLIDAWPSLPRPVKAGIVAMVNRAIQSR